MVIEQVRNGQNLDTTVDKDSSWLQANKIQPCLPSKSTGAKSVVLISDHCKAQERRHRKNGLKSSMVKNAAQDGHGFWVVVGQGDLVRV
jgi:hypothetical protein